ncbi:MAG TPA: type III-A CRISPR-associated RAMP protein Csm4 [Blastocatellia bacterium]|nr:type III-A CRISPR-associated RAMP protein Csm4 [Blastocatellia bacterium]
MIIYLRPRAPFTKSAPRSDTLFGAIAWAIRLLYGELQLVGLLEDFEAAIASQSPPPFTISSLFPYFEDEGGKIHFLPRPLRPPAAITGLEDRAAYQDFKDLRRAGFVSQGVFNRIMLGELDETAIYAELRHPAGGVRLKAGALMTPEEHRRAGQMARLVIRGEVARNAINRLTGSTAGDGGQLFYQPVAAVGSGGRHGGRGGFYFLARPGSAEVKAMMQAALRFLGDKGFGGDSSIGRGHCAVEFDDGDFITAAADGERLVTLSLMHPGKADVEHFAKHQHATYARLERRKGFIESAYVEEARRVWKPTLFMLGEGATFPRDGDRSVYGTLFADDSPREGMAFQARINGLAYTVAIKGEAAR